jgi:hypothetical protein
MIQIKEEGKAPKQGLSIYHPRDPSSVGGFLRLGNHVLRLRWSKSVKKLFTSYYKIDSDAILKLEEQWEAEQGMKK